MLFSLISRNPSPLLLLISAAARVARAPMSTSPAASAGKATVSVEYAKSARSSCKGCSASIAKGSLRLGASAHDPRGFDSTKWYHVACFPASSHPLGPVDKVEGFDSIKDDDRDELRELEKNNKGDQTAVSPLEVPSPKKTKAHLSSPEVEAVEKASVSVEYAKSGRSSCKGCSASIAKGALRLGASAHNPRGFDSTKWYHVACFPASSHPLGPVDKVEGFDSIKDDDRDELRELEKNNKGDQTAVSPLEVPSPKKTKAHLSSPEVEAVEKASVSVEYAKSGRSTCKGCSASIAKDALRLGVSAPDLRGFDSTKWYHIACFPTSSHPLGPVENVKGFGSIKDEDREELRELEKNNKRDQIAAGPLKVPSLKKAKAHLSSPDVGMAEKASISVEYAKSGRSTCKGCSVSIAKGVLRLGASAHDPRGFDSTKWYHVACFPTSSYPLGPVEKIKGFDSIKDDDREEVRGLEKDSKRDQAAASPLEMSSSKKENAHISLPEIGVAEKSSPGNKRIHLVIPFSASDIMKTYKDAALPAHWKVFDTVIFREQVDGLHASAKIAAFDFDGCLAKTSVRSIGADKWSLQHKSIPEKLQRLYNDGYKLVIFTNESNIERWKNKRQQAVDSKVGRLDNFIECVKVPIQVYIACGLGKGKGTPDDPFRKPNPGMWWLMTEHFNSGIAINMDQSFYVGDAAGRENDHSAADIEFAKVIGLKFHVPEEYFDS